MSDTDTVMKEYMRDKATFADFFNFLIYQGDQIIKPEGLEILDPVAIALPHGRDGKIFSIQKQRDLLGKTTIMTDDRVAYIALGIENQSYINYAMPLRNLFYDVAYYLSQIERKNAARNLKGDEYLSNFSATDRLTPIITAVCYTGSDPWTGPRSLAEMFDVPDERIARFLPRYDLNVIAPAEIEDASFSKFHTELSLALKYVKYSGDKTKLRDITSGDARFRTLSRRTANMIRTVTHSDFHFSENEETIDMCQAIEDIRAEGRAEGRAEMRAEMQAEKLGMLAALVADGFVPIEEAAKRAGVSVEEILQAAGR